jgi:hypothetical protein
MKITNKYINRDTKTPVVPVKVDQTPSNILRESTPAGYKKQNRKSLRIAFRKLTLSGSLVGINKI